MARTIESEIIPRLVLARRAVQAVAPTSTPEGWTPTPEDAVRLAELVLARDAAMASEYVEAKRALGASVETLYLDLLAPTARHLGELWEADARDFTEVTLGLGRLQQVLHELSTGFQYEAARQPHGRRALLAPVPGDQHTLGLFIVTEFFRRAGWDVRAAPPPTAEELIRLVRRERFELIGFSASCEVRLDVLAATIRAVRRASRNRAVGVMVGGPLILERPELVALVGADATAPDGRQAVVQAHNLLSLLPQRH